MTEKHSVKALSFKSSKWLITLSRKEPYVHQVWEVLELLNFKNISSNSYNISLAFDVLDIEKRFNHSLCLSHARNKDKTLKTLLLTIKQWLDEFNEV